MKTTDSYKTKLNRLGISFFFDERDIVDEYMFYLMQETMPFVSRMIFVVNGTINAASIERLTQMGCEVLLRPNEGFDVAAYKHGLEHVGYDAVAAFDEVILFNHTFFGPIYPFSEMFSEMESRDCDFWGITSHKEMIPNPFTNEGVLPRHINSHYIAVRQRMLKSEDFKRYWREMPHIKSYLDSIFVHESRFTKHFEDLGFVSSVYNDDRAYDSHYPSFINIDQTIEDRCPILKRRPFFHEYLFHEEYAIDLPRAVRLVEQNSDYPVELIWRNIIRSSKLRTLNTTAALTSVLPDKRLRDGDALSTVGKIAVCMHIYYTDMTADMLRMAENIPGTFDFIATTHTEENAAFIREVASRSPKVDQVIVRVVEKNRGRDMGALFITCRDLFLDDRYALVCRLHSKKSPQVDVSRSQLFKRHMEENLLNSPGYVANVIDMFEEKPWIGLAVPPIIHISYPILGQAWFNNRPKATKVAKELELGVPFDDDTPVAAYGTMFWFRPKALRKLFAREWAWEEFNAEPHHVDGGLAHVLERLIAYTAQDAGYLTQHILCPHQAAQNYVSLEYKAQKVGACLGGTYRWQFDQLQTWVAAGRPMALPETQTKNQSYSGAFWNARWREAKPEALAQEPTDSLVGAYKAKMQGWQDNYIARTTKSRRDTTPYKVSESDILAVTQYIQKLPYYFSIWAGEDLQQAVRHYLVIGWLAGKELLCMFDSGFYLERYPDVRDFGMHPLVHFVRHGSAEERSPHPLFDASFCAAQFRTRGLDSCGDILLDYLTLKTPEVVQPHPLFDPAFYTRSYPEVAKAGLNMLAHYLKFGAAEGRSPHPLFDGQFYSESHPHLRQEGINPLVHYLTVGSSAGHDPHPAFDVDYYLEHYGHFVAPGTDPLVDFALNGHDGSRNPHPLFDSARYCKDYGHLLGGNVNPLVHYVTNGFKNGCNPGGCFDQDFYLKTYPEIRNHHLNPLCHYLCKGSEERRAPNALFDEGYYVNRYPEALSTGLIGFQHYIKYGAAKGYSPGPDFDSGFYLQHSPEVARLGINPLAHYTHYGKKEGRLTHP